MIDPELLRHFPYFAGIDPETLHAVAAVSGDRKLKPSEELFEEGEPATHLFIITRGHVDVVLTLADGKQVAVDAFPENRKRKIGTAVHRQQTRLPERHSCVLRSESIPNTADDSKGISKPALQVEPEHLSTDIREAHQQMVRVSL